ARAQGLTVFGHGRGDRSTSRATPSPSGRIPTHEPERRRRLSLPAARAAPPASSRPFPQPGPSTRSLSWRLSPLNPARGPLPHVAADDVENQVDSADV